MLYPQEPTLRDALLQFDYTDDKEVRYIPKDKAKGSTTAYLTADEIREIASTLGDAALVLMTHYFAKVKTPKYDFFDDTKVSTSFGWQPTKTRRIRQQLVKHGWIKRIVYTQPTTKAKVTVFYIGKEMCSKVETPEEFNQRVRKLEEKRKPIMEKLGCSTWKEVMANHTKEEILACLTPNKY